MGIVLTTLPLTEVGLAKDLCVTNAIVKLCKETRPIAQGSKGRAGSMTGLEDTLPGRLCDPEYRPRTPPQWQ